MSDAQSIYGDCPKCGAMGVTRERRPGGNDRCARGHSYPSAQAIHAPVAAKPFTTYVCGFLFSPCGGLVVLIEKARPAWQAGKLNGVGGKVEPGESPDRAMAREFYEETGVLVPISDWNEFAVMNGPDFKIHFYRAMDDRWHNCRTVTDEQIKITRVALLDQLPTVPNLRFLIPLALSNEGLGVVELNRTRGDEAKIAA